MTKWVAICIVTLYPILGKSPPKSIFSGSSLSFPGKGFLDRHSRQDTYYYICCSAATPCAENFVKLQVCSNCWLFFSVVRHNNPIAVQKQVPGLPPFSEAILRKSSHLETQASLQDEEYCNVIQISENFWLYGHRSQKIIFTTVLPTSSRAISIYSTEGYDAN